MLNFFNKKTTASQKISDFKSELTAYLAAKREQEETKEQKEEAAKKIVELKLAEKKREFEARLNSSFLLDTLKEFRSRAHSGYEGYLDITKDYLEIALPVPQIVSEFYRLWVRVYLVKGKACVEYTDPFKYLSPHEEQTTEETMPERELRVFLVKLINEYSGVLDALVEANKQALRK